MSTMAEQTLNMDVEDPALEEAQEPVVRQPRKRGPEEGKDEKIERWLKDHGVEFYYDPNAPIALFNIQESLHNQARMKPTEDAVVERYVLAWQNGVEFPPLVAHNLHPSERLINVDGNHRLVAASKAGIEMLPVYVITKAEPKALTVLTYEANVGHGWPTSVDERIEQGVQLVQAGAKITQVHRSLQVPIEKLRQAVQREKALARITDMGIPIREWNDLPRLAQQKLASIRNNDVMREAYKVVQKAALPQPEVNDLVDKVQQVEHDPKLQKEVITSTEQIHADRIAETAGGVFGRSRGQKPHQRTARGQTMMALGAIKALPSAEIIAKQIPMQERPAVIDKVNQAVDCLTTLCKELEKKS